MTEFDTKSASLEQTLVDLQRQLEQVIQNQSLKTRQVEKNVSEEDEERLRIRTETLRELMKTDLDDLQGQIQHRMDQFEDRVSLLAKMLEDRPALNPEQVAEKSSSQDSSLEASNFEDYSPDVSQDVTTEVAIKADESSDLNASEIFPESKPEVHKVEIEDDVQSIEVNDSADETASKIKTEFSPVENGDQSGWSDSLSSLKEHGNETPGQTSLWKVIGISCLGLVLGAGGTVVMMYLYPDIWVISLPKILFVTLIALMLLMFALRRIQSDLVDFVTLSVGILAGWILTILYLSSSPQFQFLSSVLFDKAAGIIALIITGLICIFLSLISRKVSEVASYVFVGMGTFLSFAIAGNLN